MRVAGLAAQDECRLSATTLERKLIAPVDNFATCALTPPGMYSLANTFSRILHNITWKIYDTHIYPTMRKCLVPMGEGGSTTLNSGF